VAAAAPTAAPSVAVTKTVEELVVAFSVDPGHMEPRVDSGTPGFSVLNHVYDNLLWRNELTTPMPWLVEKWEQVNPTTLRLSLRKGVKFHNGEDFTAESVRSTIQQLIAPTSRSNWKSKLDVITDFKIADPHTIDLITAQPNRPLLRNITNVMALSPKALADLGDKFSTNPVGTGQYKFVEYKPGQHALFERNPDYWGKKANFQRIRIRFIPENGTRLAALEAGEVMFVDNVPPDQISRLKGNKDLQVQISRSNRVIFVQLRGERKLLSDKRVRQAMNYAVDKEAITRDLLGGMAPIAGGPMAEALFAARTDLPLYKYDPERAKRLLTEAGAVGATWVFGSPNGRYLLDRQVAQAIAGYVDAVGIKVNHEIAEWASFIAEQNKYENGRYDSVMLGVGVGSGEPDHQMKDYYHSKSARRPGYSNPEVDKLLDEAAQSFDEARVKAAYSRAQELIWDDCPWIWLYEQPDITATNTKLKWTGGRRDEYHLFWDASM
jgi:peptide/nickel transport system substrate-binding protein